MRGPHIISFFLLLETVIFANTVTVKCSVNHLAVGLAVRYLLDQGGYQTTELFNQEAFIYQTDPKMLTREETARYLAESSADAVYVRLIVTVTADDRNQSTVGLEVIFEAESAREERSTLISSGLLEQEMRDVIQKTVERFRKVPSLN